MAAIAPSKPTRPARKKVGEKAHSHFGPELFDFLLELRFNNDRAWFQVNKKRYEQLVKRPVLEFIEALAPRLKRLNPDYEAGPRSLFRINRDTRFSHDKSPYKTHASAQFRHALGSRDVHMPGFYLHLEPEASFLAAGMWMPEPENLRRIRAAIARQDHRWLALRKKLEMDGEGKLTRPPKGYEASHPLIEDLKQKSFTASINLTEAQVCSPDFLDVVTAGYKKLNPLNEFLGAVLLLSDRKE